MKYSTLCLALLLFSACAGDEEPGTGNGGKETVTVSVKVSAKAESTTRAWKDNNAVADKSEMMRNWIAVVADESGNIEKIIEQNAVPEGNEEIDEIRDVSLTAGRKTFYTFANISKAELEKVLGMTLSEGGRLDGTMESAAFSVSGNGFLPSQNIPMSNKQVMTVADGMECDLIVVRMLAKMEFCFFNESGKDMRIKSVTLSDVTTNAEGNLMLLPEYADGTDSENTMEAVHGSIRPNLPEETETSDFEYVFSDGGLMVSASENATQTTALSETFYINECAVPKNLFGHFILTLDIETDSERKELRYALINDANADGFSGYWNYIARNDYRIIPVSLDDYKLDVIPYDFPPIGVYPASVKEEDGLFTCTFHAGGHFHIRPVVSRYSTGEELPYGTAENTWTYETWTNPELSVNGESGNLSIYLDGSSDIEDASDNGGIPVWDARRGYIFGKMYDQSGRNGAAYHELTVAVKKQGGARRMLTYRLLNILDIPENTTVLANRKVHTTF
ncbi:MAG: hypothetical protein NC206_08495 [Bacteroides sp.]|nr:hypothetical protein [Roseburia sp.]MCM1347108.1 hypothetical protein [Bacteroides sp.]MCM1420712.1 hypothetical protein [Bacteroides sp.]